MSLGDLDDWMDENSGVGIVWFLKRLSANDTLATNAHQAGPYFPKEFLFGIFPRLNNPSQLNPDVWFDMRIDSHHDVRKVRAVWYNNRLHGKTRNETRLTNFGGASSALLDPESTGALVVFAFHAVEDCGTPSCNVWVCEHGTEEDLVEGRTGPIQPGENKIWTLDDAYLARTMPDRPRPSCWLSTQEFPAQWLVQFPSPSEIIYKTVELRPDQSLEVDQRLLRRRECEFELFKSIEQQIELPWISQGFRTIDEFVSRAQTILQRRKSRSGRSLELHLKTIFLEEGLQENNQFSHQPQSEEGKTPDFLFPSEAAYRDSGFPTNKLKMLAVKTTCRDRWRQVINEADRIQLKHLLTLQEGVSEAQFQEMTNAGVLLVVPRPLISFYPISVQPYLQTLESFVADIRLL